MTYQSDEAGAHNIYVRPFRTGSTAVAVRVSPEGGTHPCWSRDGRELFFLARAGELHAARLVARAPLAFSPPILLFRSPLVRTPPVSAPYDVEPDGSLLLNVTAGPPTPITLLQHWARLLPQCADARGSPSFFSWLKHTTIYLSIQSSYR